jgi:aminoglycoside phosphotransferase family enzyme/predicted kinase
MAASALTESDMQERVFASLTDPATHHDVKRIDTHGASVFLEGSRALKIKRAVKFPFLDYSTLEKRKAACHEELKINQQFAPQIYRRVVAITQKIDGSLEIDGDGRPVEFAIEMIRFDERLTFDHLAEAGPIDLELIYAVAETVAASHRHAAPAPAEPWLRSISSIIDGNTAGFREDGSFPAEEINDLAQASFAAYSRLTGSLEQRGKQGFVRRCHGDLHLANIALIGGKPVLFDAIEFDPVIASVDLLYDVAFPLMDFLHYDRITASNVLLNKYLELSKIENLDALALLPLFMSMRSAIRARVLLARIDRNLRDGVDYLQSARAYFELARRVIRPPPPMLVAVGGLSGTGKTLAARALAPGILPAPGAVILRTDVMRKQYFRVKETDRLPESAYRPEVTETIYNMLALRASRILTQGHSVVVDAVFASESERAVIAGLALAENVRFSGLFLTADLAIRQQRIGRRDADASDATPEIAKLQEKYDLGRMDWAKVDASGTSEQTLHRCLAHLR